ncbi:MAG: 3-dehydroquinate synthase [Spirochaetia bacterium]|nr:3-dehydroquinate synthase [Spirochaetia bacterium]
MSGNMKVTLANGKETNVQMVESLQELSEKLGGYGNNVLWVADSNTATLFKRFPSGNVIIEAGELSKTFSSVERILREAVDQGLGRDSYIIGFGGGVVCDLAGFAASIYMRGCRLVLVPTSLLCMVDATLGGKTGCDFQGGKNLVGTFYPAHDVLICPDLLKSLREREFHNGLAEVLKHALLSEDEQLYKFLISRKSQILERDPTALHILLELSLKVKKSYIERDPEETKGVRQALNLGHTFGHALESCGRFSKFSHGEAVAWGTVCSLEAGVLMGVTDPAFAHSAKRLFASYDYDPDYRIGRGEWLEFIGNIAKDKKKKDGIVQFVIMEKQGKYRLMEVPTQIVKRVVLESPISSGAMV